MNENSTIREFAVIDNDSDDKTDGADPE